MNSQGGRSDLDALASLAGEGPTEAVLGHAFLTLVEPHLGHDEAYTRWYEDDHFHAGAMAFPWWFSGRRWVATRALRDLRESSDHAVPLDRGWTFATYWITRGRLAEQAVWLETTVGRLLRGGRMFTERSHVMTGYHDHVGEWQAVEHRPRGVHALEYPYAGLVMEVVDLGAGHEAWLVDQHVRPRLEAGEASQCLAFAPVAWPGRSEPSWFDYAANPRGRVVLLWFLERDPRTDWGETFGRHRVACEAAGSRVAFLGGFVPTLPGTDTYLDELR